MTKRERSEAERDTIVDSLRCWREEDPPPENPPPGPKWQARQGLVRLDLNGAELRVMWGLIDHANAKTGLCYPSQSRLAIALNMPARTVRKAIASLKVRKLIQIVERFDARGKTSNLYLIDWPPLFAASADMRRKPKQDATPRPKQDATPRPKQDAKPFYDEPRKLNQGHEMVQLPSAARTYSESQPLNGIERKRASKEEIAARDRAAYEAARRKRTPEEREREFGIIRRPRP